VAVLLPGHAGEQLGVGREIRAQPLGEIAVDVGVLGLGGDGEGQDLGFVQVSELNGANLLQERAAGTNVPGPSIRINGSKWGRFTLDCISMPVRPIGPHRENLLAWPALAPLELHARP
jgi:hypothetical protein